MRNSVFLTCALIAINAGAAGFESDIVAAAHERSMQCAMMAPIFQ